MILLKKNNFEYFKFKTIFILSFFSFAGYSILLLNNHINSFFLGDFDYNAISEIILNTSKGDFFQSTHYGKLPETNYLTHHFSPFLVIFIPFQFFSDIRLGYGYGLIFFYLSSILLIYLILKNLEITPNQKIISFCILTINPFFFRLNYSYHFELIFLTLVLFSFLMQLKKKFFAEGIVLFLCLLIKEDIAIYLILYQFYLFFLTRRKQYIFQILISIFYFIFIKLYIQPAFGDSAKVNWLESWEYLGNSPLNIIKNILLNPILVFKLFYLKIEILISIVCIFLISFIYSKKVILFLLPIICVHFLSERIWYNTFNNYYSYTILSFLYISFFIGIQKLKETKIEKIILLVSLFFSIYFFSNDKSIPYKQNPSQFQRMNSLKQMIEMIPANFKISVSYDIGVFFNKRNKLYPIRLNNLDKDFILLDKDSVSPFVNLDEIMIEMKKKELNKSYSLIEKNENLYLWKKL